MIDCSKEISSYHGKHVRLPEVERSEMRNRRQANQTRLKNGLSKDEKSPPERFVKQGSYAMHTMVQHPDKDYDIDDGAVFAKDDLVGPKGGDMSAKAARDMVRDAVDDGSFKTPPVVRTNCVRVVYDAGYHVDIPVYREFQDEWGEVVLELAGADWRVSDPTELTQWFNGAVIDRSPDTTNGRQMRRCVCLLKRLDRSRKYWNLPSGLILSVLTDECYIPHLDRDDEAFHETVAEMHQRLDIALSVFNPVDSSEELTKGPDDPKTRELRDRLAWVLERLTPVKDETCDRNEALKRWGEVFATDYFAQFMTEEEDGGADKANRVKAAVAAAMPTAPRSWLGDG